MPSQFEESTEQMDKDILNFLKSGISSRKSFTAGRNSARESLEIMARAVTDALGNLKCASQALKNHGDDYLEHQGENGAIPRLEKIIAAVKARGDWPLEDK